MITDNILIPHLEISVYNAYKGYKGKIEGDMFLEGYIHLIQPAYIRVQTTQLQKFCLQLIFYVAHLRRRGYIVNIANKRKYKRATFICILSTTYLHNVASRNNHIQWIVAIRTLFGTKDFTVKSNLLFLRTSIWTRFKHVYWIF